MTSNPVMPVVAALALCAATGGVARAADPVGTCGWALPSGDTLAFKPDAHLDPRKAGPLPKPPQGAVAAWCSRDTMVVEHPDFRVLRELRLPYIVEHGVDFGVLQYPPAIVLEYHSVGRRFVRGRAPDPTEQKNRT